MNETKVCFSLVLYKHSCKSIEPLLSSIAAFADYAPKISVLLNVYDGSPPFFPYPPETHFRQKLPNVDISFQKGPNVGFGCANNRNFFSARLDGSALLVVVNPDIRFSAHELLPIVCWAFDHYFECSCVAPLVCLEGGKIQYSAKHNPTLLSLFLGRFSFFRRFSLFRSYDSWHKNLDKDYVSDIIESTYLSGCFLVVPAWAFLCVGGFCEKYFLHIEDADLVRRLSSVGKTLHNPIGVVEHGWARGSHSSVRQILSLLRSYLTYCMIWGIRLV